VPGHPGRWIGCIAGVRYPRVMTAVLLPVGHCLGAAPDPASGAWVQRVRVGPDVVRLSEPQFAVWALTHGDPDRPAGQRWGEEAVLAAAHGLADPAGLLAGLVADGLVASVAPGTPDALNFARAFQLRPLMLGLGNLDAEPETYEIGLPGQPVAQVGDVLYRLYLWGHLEPDLWAACQATAAVSPAAFADALVLLDAVIEAMHALLSPNAAYLDTV
jgi:hypothetical protein